MIVKLTVQTLQLNLLLEDCQFFILLDDKSRENSLPEHFCYERTDEYVLMSQLTDIDIMDTDFAISIEDDQEDKIVDLYTFAIASSTSKVVLLGKTSIFVGKTFIDKLRSQEAQTLKQSLDSIKDQRGNITFKLELSQFTQRFFSQNRKFSEIFQKQETTSSDSYDANKKEIDQSIDFDNISQFSQIETSAIRENQKNKYSQDTIFQDIELQDLSDEQQEQKHISLNKSSKSAHLIQSNPKCHTLSCEQNEKNNYLKSDYFLQQSLKIEKYIHQLQIHDYLMIKINQDLLFYNS